MPGPHSIGVFVIYLLCFGLLKNISVRDESFPIIYIYRVLYSEGAIAYFHF